MADVTIFDPVWATTGETRAFGAGEVTAGAVAQEVDFQLFNALFDREETKINAIIAQLPTEDQKDALDAATSPSDSNAFTTIADISPFPDPFIIQDHFANINGVENYNPYWHTSGNSRGSCARVNTTGSICDLKTDSDDDDEFLLTGGIAENIAAKNPVLKLYFKLIQTTLCHFSFGLYEDANNFIHFDYDTDVDANWHTITNASGTPSTDTGDTGAVAADTDWHEFEIRITSAQVLFYIDSVLKATHTTNIPATGSFRRIYLQTRTTATKSAYLDWFKLRQDM